MKYATLARACNSRLTFLQILDICSLNASWLTIIIPRSLTDFSQIIDFPSMFIDNSSCLCEIKSLHLSAFNFQKLILNQTNRMLESNCSESVQHNYF